MKLSPATTNILFGHFDKLVFTFWQSLNCLSPQYGILGCNCFPGSLQPCYLLLAPLWWPGPRPGSFFVVFNWIIIVASNFIILQSFPNHVFIEHLPGGRKCTLPVLENASRSLYGSEFSLASEPRFWPVNPSRHNLDRWWWFRDLNSARGLH